MPLAPGDLLGSVKAMGATLFRGFDRLTIDNGSAGGALAPHTCSSQLPQVRVDLLPGAVEAPTSQIVIDRRPGAVLGRQIPPRTATAQHVEQAIENAPNVDRAWPSAWLRGGNQGREQRPFAVTEVTGIHWRGHGRDPFQNKSENLILGRVSRLAFLFLHTLSLCV